MLVGEPGIGKTRTCQELADAAVRRDGQVLWGRCYEDPGTPSYWPWTQVFRTYIRGKDPEQIRSVMGPGATAIAEVFPEVSTKLPELEPIPFLQPEQARFRLFDAVSTFLKNVSHSQPTLLVLDDLHWADQPSLLLLEHVAHEIESSQIMVAGTYRDVEISRQHPLTQTLGSLIRETNFLILQLRGLTQQEVAEFLRLASGLSLSPSLVEEIHGRTGGNPLFVHEISRAMHQEGVDENQNYIASVPEGVKAIVGRRLNRLSDNCSRVLTTASIIGQEFAFPLLGAVHANMTEDESLAVIDEGLEKWVIEQLPGHIEHYHFSHALFRDTLSEELSTSRRIRMHARIAQAIEELHGDNVEAQVHFQQALEIKGEEQSSTSSRSETDAETAGILFGLGSAQGAAGQVPEAWNSLSRAFDYYCDAQHLDRVVAVAEYPLFYVPTVTNATRMVSQALTLVPPDSWEAGRLLARYGLLTNLEAGDYRILRSQP